MMKMLVHISEQVFFSSIILDKAVNYQRNKANLMGKLGILFCKVSKEMQEDLIFLMFDSIIWLVLIRENSLF